MEPTVQELLKIKSSELSVASNNTWVAKRTIRELRRSMKDAAEARIDLFLNCLDETKALASAGERELALGGEVRELADRAALEKTPPHPLGTVMVQWKRIDNWTSGARRFTYSLTGERGILEVVTSMSQHPDKLTYGKASVGSYIIRILRRNGTPGKSYIEYGSGRWEPEGIDLNPKMQESQRKAKEEAAAKESAELLSAFYGGGEVRERRGSK